MNILFKALLILLLNLSYSLPLSAKVVEKDGLQFKIDTEALMKGEIHYSFSLVPVRDLIEKFPEAIDLDPQGILQEGKLRFLLTKSVFVVNRPVGFFDHDQMMDPDFLSHLLGEQTVKALGPNAFKVKVPGPAAHSYRLTVYYDSDDISTLPGPRIVQGVSAAKKLDVISQSASSILFREYSRYSKYAAGGSSVSSHIPLKEGKTLVITYSLFGIQKNYAIAPVLKANFLQEVKNVRKLIDSYSE